MWSRHCVSLSPGMGYGVRKYGRPPEHTLLIYTLYIYMCTLPGHFPPEIVYIEYPSYHRQVMQLGLATWGELAYASGSCQQPDLTTHRSCYPVRAQQTIFFCCGTAPDALYHEDTSSPEGGT